MSRCALARGFVIERIVRTPSKGGPPAPLRGWRDGVGCRSTWRREPHPSRITPSIDADSMARALSPTWVSNSRPRPSAVVSCAMPSRTAIRMGSRNAASTRSSMTTPDAGSTLAQRTTPGIWAGVVQFFGGGQHFVPSGPGNRTGTAERQRRRRHRDTGERGHRGQGRSLGGRWAAFGTVMPAAPGVVGARPGPDRSFRSLS